jgi:hypothetical protein
MNKIRMAALAIVPLLTSANVYAEVYLFPTDIVDKGRVDLRASVVKETYSQTLRFSPNLVLAEVEERRDRISESVGARYGIAKDWHIEVLLPYDSRARLDTRVQPNGSLTVTELSQNFDGAGNIEFGVKHRFIGSAESTFNLSGRVLVGANTAGDSKTTLMTEAIAGWLLSDTLKTYAGYQGQFSDQDTQPNRHSLLMGLYKRVHERLTVVPQANFSYYEPAHLGSMTTSGHINQYSLGISAHWKLYKSTYLIPGFAYGQISSYSYGPLAEYDKSTGAKAYSLTLYHLF